MTWGKSRPLEKNLRGLKYHANFIVMTEILSPSSTLVAWVSFRTLHGRLRRTCMSLRAYAFARGCVCVRVRVARYMCSCVCSNVSAGIFVHKRLCGYAWFYLRISTCLSVHWLYLRTTKGRPAKFKSVIHTTGVSSTFLFRFVLQFLKELWSPPPSILGFAIHSISIPWECLKRRTNTAANHT